MRQLFQDRSGGPCAAMHWKWHKTNGAGGQHHHRDRCIAGSVRDGLGEKQIKLGISAARSANNPYVIREVQYSAQSAIAGFAAEGDWLFIDALHSSHQTLDPVLTAADEPPGLLDQ